MFAAQNGPNLDLFLAGDENELRSTANGNVKKIKFSIPNQFSRETMTFLYATGRVNNNKYIQTDDSSIFQLFPL
jgi:hypothetical protein